MDREDSSWENHWGTTGDGYNGETGITKAKKKKAGGKMDGAKKVASAGFDKAAVGAKKVAKVSYVKAKAVAGVGAKKVKIGTVLGFKWVKAKCTKKKSSS